MQRKEGPRPSKPENKFAAFGIRYLDNMLAGKVDQPLAYSAEGFENMGLPCATVTALIGDSLTQKTRLGRAFLGRCFAQYPARLVGLANAFEGEVGDVEKYLELLIPGGAFISAAIARFRRDIAKARGRGDRGILELAAALLAISGGNSRDGVAVLLTTGDVDAKTIVREFIQSLPRDSTVSRKYSNLEGAIAKYCFERTICRRFEVHDLPSPILMHIVQRAIRQAQSIMINGQQTPRVSERPQKRFSQSHAIRVVIEDFSALLGTYPEVSNDPLFLPTLLFHLRREGVTTLIVDTHSGQPGMSHIDAVDSELRTLVDQRLYTWHVPFYGENRVAIAPIPPLSGGGGART